MERFVTHLSIACFSIYLCASLSVMRSCSISSHFARSIWRNTCVYIGVMLCLYKQQNARTAVVTYIKRKPRTEIIGKRRVDDGKVVAVFE